jgi:hypothetical protein
MVRGTLWPVLGDPTFVVGSRRVTAERGAAVVAEATTDRRGRFEIWFYEPGKYSVIFQTDTHRAAADVTLGQCSTQKVDLIPRAR